MEEERTYKRWNVSPTDLVDMTPVKALRIISKCFFEARKETFSRAGKKLGNVPDPEQLKNTVEGAIRLT